MTPIEAGKAALVVGLRLPRPIRLRLVPHQRRDPRLLRLPLVLRPPVRLSADMALKTLLQETVHAAPPAAVVVEETPVAAATGEGVANDSPTDLTNDPISNLRSNSE
jgi:hypothetical protein